MQVKDCSVVLQLHRLLVFSIKVWYLTFAVASAVCQDWVVFITVLQLLKLNIPDACIASVGIDAATCAPPAPVPAVAAPAATSCM